MAFYNLRVLQLHHPGDLRDELRKINAASPQINDQTAQGTFRAVKLERIPSKLARFLYQELVLEGGAVVLPARLDDRAGEADVLLLGTRYQLQHLAIRIRTQSESDLNLLADELERVLDLFDQPLRGAMKIGAAEFQWGARTYVMGIVNVTPDSFSGDAILATENTGNTEKGIDRAVAQAEQMIADGADSTELMTLIQRHFDHTWADRNGETFQRRTQIPIIGDAIFQRNDYLGFFNFLFNDFIHACAPFAKFLHHLFLRATS